MERPGYKRRKRNRMEATTSSDDDEEEYFEPVEERSNLAEERSNILIEEEVDYTEEDESEEEEGNHSVSEPEDDYVDVDENEANQPESTYDDYFGEDSSLLLAELDFRLSMYVHFALKCRLSETDLENLDKLMEANCMHKPMFNNSDVRRVLVKLENETVKATTIRCLACGKEKRSTKTSCEYHLCDLHQISGDSSYDSISCELNIASQAKDILGCYGSEIFSFHKTVHNHDIRFDSYELRTSPGYRRLMESKADFENNRINLLYTGFCDAARLKRHSRKDATPLLLRLEGLTKQTKSEETNMLLCTVNFASGGVSKSNVTHFFQKSFEEIDGLTCDVQIETSPGVHETITFVFMCISFILDMKESKSVSGIPNWTNVNGCGVCLITGQRNNSSVSFCEIVDSEYRNDDDTILDSINGVRGFSKEGKPFIYNYINPTKFHIDIFHCLNLGLLKYLLSEIVKPDHWPTAKLRNGRLEALNEATKNYRPYTYASCKHPTLLQKCKATGMEIFKLSQVVLPLSAASSDYVDGRFGSFCLGWFFFLTFYTNQDALDLVQKLLNFLLVLHNEIEAGHFPLKHHVIYKHFIDHLKTFGTELSTEQFERCHKQLQLLAHDHATNIVRNIATRFVSLGVIKRSVSTWFKAKDVPKVVSSYFENDSKENKNDEFVGNEIPEHAVKPLHLEIIKRCSHDENKTYYKRACRYVCGKKYIFSSDEYWRVVTSDSSTVLLWNEETTNREFGRIVLIFEVQNERYALMKLYKLESFDCMFSNLISKLDFVSTSREILRICQAFPLVFGKIKGEDYKVVRFDSIISPAIKIKYENDYYIKKY